MVLKDTIEMMVSEDYKERFKAEYLQLALRLGGLKAMLAKWDNGELNFSPTCPRDIYDEQVEAMESYLKILTKRAEIEKISLLLSDN